MPPNPDHSGPIPPRRPPSGEGRFCLDCHYPLRGLRSPGKCPECGRDFDFTLLYSYGVDPAPPTWWQRLLSRRLLALVGAVAVEAFWVWLMNSGMCMIRIFPLVFLFLITWQLFVATGLDRSVDHEGLFILIGALFGVIAIIPLGFPRFVMLGILGGGLCGHGIYYMKSVGWID